jgi:CBS domain-containing protein
MKTVRDVLGVKGDAVWSTTSEASVYEALEKMAEKNVGALVVLDNTELVGIFSERDYAREIILKGRASKQTVVGEIMTREVACVAATEKMEKCMLLMSSMRCRHLPVIEDDQVIGIISIGDVVKAIISDQEIAIDELKDYIVGRR